MKTMLTAGLAGVLAAMLAEPAVADDDARAPAAPELLTPYGMSLAAGGGLAYFAERGTREFVKPAGTWELRFSFGTRSLIAFEAAYSGGLQSIDALGMDDGARLLSTAFGANLRMNLIEEEAWQPYVLAGGTWNRYRVTNADFNASSMRESDRVFEFPLGAGVSYRHRGFVADGRLLYRMAIGAELIRTEAGEAPARLDAFGVNLGVGVEF